jgi:hypothetical protein
LITTRAIAGRQTAEQRDRSGDRRAPCS